MSPLYANSRSMAAPASAMLLSSGEGTQDLEAISSDPATINRRGHPLGWSDHPPEKDRARLQHEEELPAAGRVSSSTDRRKDQRTRRLAGQDPRQASRPDQTGRP